MKQGIFVFICIAIALAMAACTNPAGASTSASETGNRAPYPVVSATLLTANPTVELTNRVELDAGPVRNDDSIQFAIQTDSGGLRDPDGDTTSFQSSGLSAYSSLDADTGLLTVSGADRPTDSTSFTIEVWSQDMNGADTRSQAYVLELVFVKT